MSKLQIAMVGTMLFVGAAVLVVFQQKSIRQLRAENQALSEQASQLDPLRAENAQLAKLKVDANELTHLREQSADLLRLRAEVTQLRNEKAKAEQLKAENTQLRQTAEQMASQQRAQRLEVQQTEEAKQQGIERMNSSRQLALALIMFANDNEGRFPQRFDQAGAYLQGSPLAQLSDAQFEIVYAGRLNEVTNTANTIVIRERQPRVSPDGRQSKAYAFADGHAETHTTANGDFASWEQTRLAAPRLSR